MDKESAQKLENILKKELFALTKLDILFLRARQSYLNPEQLEKYLPLFDMPKRGRKAKTN